MDAQALKEALDLLSDTKFWESDPQEAQALQDTVQTYVNSPAYRALNPQTEPGALGQPVVTSGVPGAAVDPDIQDFINAPRVKEPLIGEPGAPPVGKELPPLQKKPTAGTRIAAAASGLSQGAIPGSMRLGDLLAGKAATEERAAVEALHPVITGASALGGIAFSPLGRLGAALAPSRTAGLARQVAQNAAIGGGLAGVAAAAEGENVPRAAAIGAAGGAVPPLAKAAVPKILGKQLAPAQATLERAGGQFGLGGIQAPTGKVAGAGAANAAARQLEHASRAPYMGMLMAGGAAGAMSAGFDSGPGKAIAYAVIGALGGAVAKPQMVRVKAGQLAATLGRAGNANGAKLAMALAQLPDEEIEKLKAMVGSEQTVQTEGEATP